MSTLSDEETEKVKEIFREMGAKAAPPPGVSAQGDRIIGVVTMWRLIVGFVIGLSMLSPVCVALLERRLDDRYDARIREGVSARLPALDERYDLRYVRAEALSRDRAAEARFQEQVEKNREAQFASMNKQMAALDKKIDDRIDAVVASLNELRKGLKQ